VTVVQHADKARLLSGRSKTLPIVIFMTIMIAVIGLSVLLENLRPRVRPVAAEQKGARPDRTPAPATTRSA
jgi:fructose-specific phosphotransferase system IIC component